MTVKGLAEILGLVKTIWEFMGRSKKWTLLVLTLIGVVAAGYNLWSKGPPAWLGTPITLPLWAFILLVVIAAALPLGVVRVVTIIRNRRKAQTAILPTFEAHGVLWEVSDLGIRPDPLCPKCEIQMKHDEEFSRLRGSKSFYTLDIWTCRDCSFEFMWDRQQKGDLAEDLAARYNASLRKSAKA